MLNPGRSRYQLASSSDRVTKRRYNLPGQLPTAYAAEEAHPLMWNTHKYPKFALKHEEH